MPALSVMIKPSSSMCNMSCDYCFYCDESEKRLKRSYGFMSEETLKNTIRRTMLCAEGMISYCFQGGEPTLAGIEFFEKAVFYQKKYNRNHIFVQNSFQTNGLSIDKDWCRLFRENNILVGISVDGIRRTHDAFRHGKDGSPTYNRIIETTRLFDRWEVEYNILTVVTPEIVRNIAAVFRDYRKKGWNYQQYIACLDPLNEPRGQIEYSLQPEIYGRFLVKLFELWYEDLKKGCQPYIRQFENYVRLAAGYMAESCDQRGTCAVQYVVEADGSVFPCDFYMLDEYCLGNFNENNIDELNEKCEKMGFIERSMKLDEKCKKCDYYLLCRGGCQRNRELNPHTDMYENYFCQSYQIFFEQCYNRIMEIARGVRHAKKRFYPSDSL